MASDAAPPVNGTYNGHQYGSPAELPAPTPGVSHGPSASQSTTASTTAAAAKADPQEIGWYFVEQYYTTLSKNPERIHLFYSKKSQLVIGVEAEKVVPAVGVKAINEKMKELDIQDCKVRVLNVDSQASYHNIVVQVIGEMSNKSEPHHRFVQTFVLAEQPNGYFVLNDIFRYLNDDEDEIVEDEAPQEIVLPIEEKQESPVAPVAETENTQDTVVDETAADKVDAKLEEVAKEEEAEAETSAADVNGGEAESAVEPQVTADEVPETTQDVFEEANKSAAEEPLADMPATEQPHDPEPTRAQSPTKTAEPTTAADVAPTRKTWASMVGAKAPVVPSATPPAAVASSQAKAQKTPQPAAPQSVTSDTTPPAATQGNGWQMADHGKKQNKPQAKTPTTEPNALAYIKNVNEKIAASDLRAELEKHGELKYFDVSRQRNCAFVEFADAAGYNAAVAANPHTVGTEQILVEERRPRPNAFGGSNASFTRGGATAGRGGGRGSMQGRGGSQGGGFPKDAGRGNFQQRGGKSGNVTPKGRGQAQAV